MEFKKINFDKNCKSPIYDNDSAEIPPIETKPSNSSLKSSKDSSPGIPEIKKHVRILVDEDNLENENIRKIPSFQKRPLSDTPIGSAWNSPKSSANNTPVGSRESSALDLIRLNKINSNSDFDKLAFLNTNEAGTLTDMTSPSGMASPSRFTHPKIRPTTLDVPGLTKSKSSPDGTISKEDAGSKLVIIMVGLPATGKSFITNKLSRYLNYSLYYCKAFNVGNTRRQFAKDNGLREQDSSFFDPDNDNSIQLREKWAMDTLQELLDYLLVGIGSVGIFDATNTTRERRKHVLDTIRKRSKDIQVLFLETVCSDKAVVEKNIKLKLLGPDYKGKDPIASLKDFKERLINYTKAYEPIEDEENLQYVKMIDVGKKVISYNIKGFLASQTVYYLLNFTLAERQIWITRNGESEYNVSGRIGGDSNLTPRGEKYAKALPKFINERRELFLELELENEDNKNEDHQVNEFFIWSSPRRRCVETIKNFDEVDYPIKQMKMLEELNAGDCEGMTYSEIQQRYPEGYADRRADKLRYRYPGIGGESYMDVINRVRSVITEIERIEDNVLIMTHRVVARVLLGYFLNLNKDIIANLDIPLHCVYCLDIKPFGITWTLWEYNEEKDAFFKVPQSVMNTTKVKEVPLVYKEKRYSIVPTAPLSINRYVSNSGPRSGRYRITNECNEKENNTNSNAYRNLRSVLNEPNDIPRSASTSNRVKPKGSAGHHFEVKDLEMKLAKLKASSPNSESDTDSDAND